MKRTRVLFASIRSALQEKKEKKIKEKKRKKTGIFRSHDLIQDSSLIGVTYVSSLNCPDWKVKRMRVAMRRTCNGSQLPNECVFSTSERSQE